jgi:hypothetical protein
MATAVLKSPPLRKEIDNDGAAKALIDRKVRDRSALLRDQTDGGYYFPQDAHACRAGRR